MWPILVTCNLLKRLTFDNTFNVIVIIWYNNHSTDKYILSYCSLLPWQLRNHLLSLQIVLTKINTLFSQIESTFVDIASIGAKLLYSGHNMVFHNMTTSKKILNCLKPAFNWAQRCLLGKFR